LRLLHAALPHPVVLDDQIEQHPAATIATICRLPFEYRRPRLVESSANRSISSTRYRNEAHGTVAAIPMPPLLCTETGSRGSAAPMTIVRLAVHSVDPRLLPRARGGGHV
jgi:hypothetical protein